MAITNEHIKESLCLAHINAVAAMAGVNLSSELLFDYGVDGRFENVVTRGKRRVSSGIPLDFQAKATTAWKIDRDHVIYDLESKAYNDFVSRPKAATTLILLLLCLPKEAASWHDVTENGTILRNCCYFHLVEGLPTDNEKSSKRIKIPTRQLFTPDSLKGLLAAERNRREGL